MLPIDIPPGTTGRALLETVLPAAHRELVPKTGAGGGDFSMSVRVDGGDSFHYDFRGADVTVHPGEAPAHLFLAVDASTLDRFVADWSGPRRYFPTFAPRGGVSLLTDPRIMKRLVLVHGRIELALPDFEGGRAAIVVGAHGGKRKEIHASSPDTVIEAKMALFDDLLAGRVSPEDALAGDGVTLRGKRLVAMQFAFALAPFFPVG